MSDWAQYDTKAALRFIAQRYAGEPLALVGHSFGGQVLGLLDETKDLKGAVLVGTQLGYYGHWPRLLQPALALYWRAFVPALTWCIGYLPGQAGLGVDLPRGVANEWARWCKHPDFFFAYHEGARERLARYHGSVLLYSFGDDLYAPPRAVQAFADAAKSAGLVHRHLTPEALNAAQIGHFGFFRPQFLDPLWTESRDYLQAVLAGNASRITVTPKHDPPPFEFTRDVLADLEQGQA
jgi:predicted alpha/beta hydrolase